MRKSVLVTGAAKRIGRRLALDFAKDGWDVAVHCNSSVAEAEEVAGIIRDIGRNAVIVGELVCSQANLGKNEAIIESHGRDCHDSKRRGLGGVRE